MFLFLLDLMNLLITEFLSKHLLWIRWITHSFHHTLSLNHTQLRHTHTHTQYIVLTVMSCEIGWEGWSAVCSLSTHKFGSQNRLSPHTCHSDTDRYSNPTPLINYTCFMKINALFKLVNDHSVHWYVVYIQLCLSSCSLNIQHSIIYVFTS